MTTWTPSSWRGLPALQLPDYPDPAALEARTRDLSRLPPLVSPEEVDHLRDLTHEAALGRRFMLQGGDCAERFEDCDGDLIAAKLKVLLQMSVVITHGARLSVFHVGRIAGQYAKPRSAALETVDGLDLPVYRGDLVNGSEPTPEARRPNPDRLLQAYFRAGVTLNHLRALVEGGFADLHHPERWDLPWEDHQHPAYADIQRHVRSTLDFLDALGVTEHRVVRTGEIFTSHEALHLPYEEALTRLDAQGRAWNLGAHMVWLGERTRVPGTAHLEYLRGIRNPLGLKVSPTVDPAELLQILDLLDPHREPGRLTLISRMGAEHVEALGPLVDGVRSAGRTVLWSCDPMHGNGLRAGNGLKTRDFTDILSEVRQTAALLRAKGAHLGALHVELTGEHVTECVGGSGGLREEDLERAYRSGCDPRLNRDQALELAFLTAAMLREERHGA